MNFKLHAVCDGQGRPLVMRPTAGQTSDYTGGAQMLDAPPPAKSLLAERGYDADWFGNTLIAKRIMRCIHLKALRRTQIPHDRTLYRQRHRIENTFGKLKTGDAFTPATTVRPHLLLNHRQRRYRQFLL